MPLRRPLHPTALLLRQPIYFHTSLFCTTSAWKSEAPNLYKTLDLEPGASAKDIKKYGAPLLSPLNILTINRQFYSLSKTHHPDHNPNDPQASERFVKISEAYAILGSAQKRERYDRDIQRAQAPPAGTRQGSHSSASSPWGARPASGLSKRRSQFRGPPPSFYRSGGWGTQGEKRQAQANGSGAAGTGEQPRGGGFGPGQAQAGSDYIPHFDREGHHWTQEQQEQRRKRRLDEENVAFADGGSTFLRFVLITAVVTFAFSVPSMVQSSVDRRVKRDDITS